MISACCGRVQITLSSCTARAPASMNSRASSGVWMPPAPITGRLKLATSLTTRATACSAWALTSGPNTRPCTIRPVSGSVAMPRGGPPTTIAPASDSATVRLSSSARSSGTRTSSGSWVVVAMVCTSPVISSGVASSCTPSSKPATPGRPIRERTQRRRSVALRSIRWTMTGTGELAHRWRWVLITFSAPGLGRPVCSSSPPGRGMARVSRALRRGRRLTGLVTIAPSLSVLIRRV